jgi:radical SAM protein with 4Fe4S-binding SPASM domain
MQAFADDLGVAFKFDSMINPRLDCSQSPAALRLTPEESVALDLQDPRRSDEWVRFADHVRRALDATPPADTVYQCGGGINAFAIDPYGRMSICVLSEKEKVDVRAGRFREGWDGFLRLQRGKKVTQQTKCVACTLKPACGMCPANGELEHGNPEAPVDYLCHTAHLRAYALGLEVTPHGPCEYCEGGHRHAELVDAAARLRENPIARTDIVHDRDGKRFLRVVDTSPAGGCGSCASH